MSTENLETKTKILAAALNLLKEKGGKGVRMSDIAREADVSRQAVYLHFESRLNLMVATVQYGDELNDAAKQVRPWAEAEGVKKLDTWIEFWGNYVPQIYGVAKALMVAKETDEAAEAAWNDRMNDVRKSCKKTVDSLAKHCRLSDRWTNKLATDLLWTTLSIPAWEQYTHSCGWSTKQYIKHMKAWAQITLTN